MQQNIFHDECIDLQIATQNYWNIYRVSNVLFSVYIFINIRVPIGYISHHSSEIADSDSDIVIVHTYKYLMCVQKV